MYVQTYANKLDRTLTHKNTHIHTHTHTHTLFHFHKQDGNDDANKPSIIPTTSNKITESVHAITTPTPSYPDAIMAVVGPDDEEKSSHPLTSAMDIPVGNSAAPIE